MCSYRQNPLTLLHPCLAMVAPGGHKNTVPQGVEAATTGMGVEKLEKLNPCSHFLGLILVPAVTSLKVQKASNYFFPGHFEKSVLYIWPLLIS